MQQQQKDKETEMPIGTWGEFKLEIADKDIYFLHHTEGRDGV